MPQKKTQTKSNKTSKIQLTVAVTPNGKDMPSKTAVLDAIQAAFSLALAEKTDWVSEVLVKYAPAKKAKPKAKAV